MKQTENMTPVKELKLMIIENFIDYFWSDETERNRAKKAAYDYVTEDHVNELEQSKHNYENN